MSTPTRLWRVTALEWLAHVAVIEAPTEDEARALAQDLWDRQMEAEEFRFSDSGLDGFDIEEVDPVTGTNR
jgi:hypothetical protein